MTTPQQPVLNEVKEVETENLNTKYSIERSVALAVYCGKSKEQGEGKQRLWESLLNVSRQQPYSL